MSKLINETLLSNSANISKMTAVYREINYTTHSLISIKPLFLFTRHTGNLIDISIIKTFLRLNEPVRGGELQNLIG